MNSIIERMLGEVHPSSVDKSAHRGTFGEQPHSDAQEETKEVELANTILSSAQQLPQSPAKDKIVQAATELKQIHSVL